MGLVIEKTEVAYLKSFPCVVVKKTFQVTCRVASFQLFCRVPASSRRQKISMILQFAPLRSNLGVGWSRDSNSRGRVPKEECGRNKGRVKSIPKADRGIGKRVSQMVLKMSEKFIQPGSGM